MSDQCPYWEDFKVGDTFEFSGAAITKAEIIEYASEYDPQPFHLDEEAAKSSLLGGLAASGWHSCARLMRLLYDTYLKDAHHLGSPGINEVRWKAPVRPGDEFHVKRTVLDTRSIPGHSDRGMVRVMFDVKNQHGNDLMTMDCYALYLRRNSAGVN